MKQLWFFVGLCITLFGVRVTNGSFVLTVKFINYTNPTGLCAECSRRLDNVTSADQLTPVCCDESPFRSDNCNNTGEARCDTRFRWTIRPFGASLETRPDNEIGGFYFTNCDGTNQPSLCLTSEGLAANPFTVETTSTDTWTGQVQFFIEALNNDFPFIIDSLLINLDNLQLGADFTEEMTFTGYHNISHMTMSFKVACQDDFCGDDCLAQQSEILSCTEDGQVVCTISTYDPLTNCEECLNDNFNGSMNCSTCLDPNFDPDMNCETCLDANYNPSTGCKTCALGPGYDPSTSCSTCLLEGHDPMNSCTQCLPNRDLSSNCTQCSPGWDISSDCMSCLPHRDPSTDCTQCLPNRDPSTDCSTCLPGWDITLECTRCLAGRAFETDCQECLANRDPSTDCSTCLFGWDNSLNCTNCLPGRDIDTNCTQCLPNRDPSTDCSTCLFAFDISRDCSVCLPGRNISTNCTTCLPGYAGEECLIQVSDKERTLSDDEVGGIIVGVAVPLVIIVVIVGVVIIILYIKTRRSSKDLNSTTAESSEGKQELKNLYILEPTELSTANESGL